MDQTCYAWKPVTHRMFGSRSHANNGNSFLLSLFLIGPLGRILIDWNTAGKRGITMKVTKNSAARPAVILGLMLLCIGAAAIYARNEQSQQAPKVISIDVPGKDYLQLLGGPPETVTMRSGRVILAPGRSVGKHSTGDNEEVLVILEGQGEMRISGGGTLSLSHSVIAYCPPHKEHDVINTGTGLLRYVYIVAKAR